MEIGKKLSLDSATLSGILDRLADRDWDNQTGPPRMTSVH